MHHYMHQLGNFRNKIFVILVASLSFFLYGVGLEPGTTTRKIWSSITVTPLLPPMKIAFWCWISAQ